MRRTKSRGSWRTYSLRTLLFLITGACIGLILWRVQVRPYSLQLVSIAALEEVGAKVRTRPAGSAWLARLMGREHFVDVIELDLSGVSDLSACRGYLVTLTQLQTIRAGNGFDDTLFAELLNARGLRRLFLKGSQVTDQGFAAVGGFHHLRLAELGRNISDAGLTHLVGKSRLAYLDLSHTQVTSAGIAHLRALPALHKVRLNDRPVQDTDLEVLLTLPRLDELYLIGCRELSVPALAKLGELAQLKTLDVSGTRIDAATLERLRERIAEGRVLHAHRY